MPTWRVRRLGDALLPRADVRSEEDTQQPWPGQWVWSKRWRGAIASNSLCRERFATTDGPTTWAFRYSSEGRSGRCPQHRCLRAQSQYPENPALHELSDDARIVVSEPLGSCAEPGVRCRSPAAWRFGAVRRRSAHSSHRCGRAPGDAVDPHAWPPCVRRRRVDRLAWPDEQRQYRRADLADALRVLWHGAAHGTIDFDDSNENRAELNPGEMVAVDYCPNPDCPARKSA